jgi:isoleucyl-tRNA synthetase
MSDTQTSPQGGAAPRGGAEKNRYRSTLNLPRTGFSMKANLVQNEPASLKRWGAMGLYDRLRERGGRRGRFVFHDGPPTPTARFTWGTCSTRP